MQKPGRKTGENKAGKKPVNNKWGNWVNMDRQLTHVKSRFKVDLDSIQDDTDLVYWMFVVVNTRWCCRTDLADYIVALNDILEPHSHLNITAKVSENIVKEGKHNEF